jgi:hypothetical protein
MSTPRQRPDAEATYVNAHATARSLVERINELLFDMPAPGDEDHPIRWTHVGTIVEVNRRLSEVVAFLDGSER